MVLVCYRTQTDIQLWMNSTTNFALCFQETRFLDASHSGKIEHDTQEFHLRCCSAPRGTQEHFHCHGNSTLQFGDHGPNCQHELALVHSPLLKESFSVCFPPLTYMLKFSGSVNPHHVHYKIYGWSQDARPCSCPRSNVEPAMLLEWLCPHLIHQHQQALMVSQHLGAHISKQW